MKTIKYIIFLLCTTIISAEEINLPAYNEFLTLNGTYTDTQETVLIKQSISNYEAGGKKKKSDTVYCLFHKNGQCVRMKTKSGIQYFFSSTQGYWVSNSKLKTPLKISGAYKIEEFEVQDILKTDFKIDYKPVGIEHNGLLLERQTKKPAYQFIVFEKKENAFELSFCDTKKKPVRKIVYHAGSVDGIPCFYKIDIYDLVFKKDSYSSWLTEEIKKADVPSSLFNYAQIKQLTQKMESLLN